MAATQQKCSICLGRFKDPKLLPCHHSFCYKCLEDHIRVSISNNSFNCPNCMRSVVLPREGVKAFQSNFYILTEEGEEQFGKGGNCSKHPGQDIQLVCQICNVAMCFQCKVRFHDTHPSKSLAKAAAEVKGTLKVTQSLCDERLKNIKLLKQECERAEKSLNEEEQAEIKAIEQHYAKVLSDLEKGATQLKEKVKSAYKIIRNENAVVTKKVLDEFELYSSSLKLIEQGTDMELFVEGPKLERKISIAPSPTTNVSLKKIGKKLYLPAGIDAGSLGALIGTVDDHETRAKKERELQEQRERELRVQRERELQEQRERELQEQRQKELRQTRQIRELEERVETLLDQKAREERERRELEQRVQTLLDQKAREERERQEMMSVAGVVIMIVFLILVLVAGVVQSKCKSWN